MAAAQVRGDNVLERSTRSEIEMLSRFGFYCWWYTRLVIGLGLMLLAVQVHSTYLSAVPWTAIEMPLIFVVVLALLRGPRSYAAYRRAAEKRLADRAK